MKILKNKIDVIRGKIDEEEGLTNLIGKFLISANARDSRAEGCKV